MKELDVVGTAEAAQVLGVEGSRIPRLRKAGRLPPPAADLAATPVWTREQILAYADGKIVKATVAVVGTAEAAELLSTDKPLNKSQIGRWVRAGVFPAPALEKRPPGVSWEPGAGLAATPLWWRRDVERFGRARSAA